jgi:hypothetical protein
MSMMKDIDIDIQEMLLDGIEPAVIAKTLNVPLEWVEATMDSLESDDEEQDDAFDDGQAYASAGWGTDEDYGFYGDDY